MLDLAQSPFLEMWLKVVPFQHLCGIEGDSTANISPNTSIHSPID
jgi:hypothetical protein